jgi:hypothetical protein
VYKFQEKLHLEVREQIMLTTTVLKHVNPLKPPTHYVSTGGEHGSSVGIVIAYGLHERYVAVRFRQWQKILLHKVSQLVSSVVC